MSDALGLLAWWTISEPVGTRTGLVPVLQELGLPKMKPASPGDVFRRLGGITSVANLPDGETETLSLIRWKPDQGGGGLKLRLERDILQTIKNADGVVVHSQKVGTALFQTISDRKKPRLTIRTNGNGHPEAYAARLRENYEGLQNALDPQAARRAVHHLLRQAEAIDLGGVYYLPNMEDGTKLERLIRAIGGGSTVSVVILYDDPTARETLRAHGWKDDS